MKERPVLMSAPMVRAILAGTKTQTRRVVKPQPPEGLEPVGRVLCSTHKPDEGKWTWARGQSHMLRDPHRVRCPYGQPGDLLWVRENFAAWWVTATGKRSHVMGYRADVDDPDWDGFGCDDPWWLDARWEPSIHMPRAFSRLTLRITDVRVQRLHEISEADAVAEGCQPLTWDGKAEAADLIDWPLKSESRPYANAYALLWDSLNGPGSWDANPFVWCVSFKRIGAQGVTE